MGDEDAYKNGMRDAQIAALMKRLDEIPALIDEKIEPVANDVNAMRARIWWFISTVGGGFITLVYAVVGKKI